MPLCPICGSEYQSDIENCPDCGYSLLSETPKTTSNGKEQQMIRTMAGPLIISVSTPYLIYLFLALTIDPNKPKLAVILLFLYILVVMTGCFMYGYKYGRSLSKYLTTCFYIPVLHIVIVIILAICRQIHNGAGLIIMTPIFIIFSVISFWAIYYGYRFHQQKTN